MRGAYHNQVRKQKKSPFGIRGEIIRRRKKRNKTKKNHG